MLTKCHIVMCSRSFVRSPAIRVSKGGFTVLQQIYTGKPKFEKVTYA